MTVTPRAREALADCEHALADFEASANTPFQRTRWVGLITLLRTVGHVLDKVDRPAARPEVQRRINEAWKRLNGSKPEPTIFHDFIDDDRNLVVKEYEIRSAVNITITPGPAGLGWGPVLAGALEGFGYAPTTFDFFMREGPFKGRDPLELCREAITFWRKYLDDIDGE